MAVEGKDSRPRNRFAAVASRMKSAVGSTYGSQVGDETAEKYEMGSTWFVIKVKLGLVAHLLHSQ